MYLAEGEEVAMPCLSGELLKVHWKCNGYNAMYYFIIPVLEWGGREQGSHKNLATS